MRISPFTPFKHPSLRFAIVPLTCIALTFAPVCQADVTSPPAHKSHTSKITLDDLFDDDDDPDPPAQDIFAKEGKPSVKQQKARQAWLKLVPTLTKANKNRDDVIIASLRKLKKEAATLVTESGTTEFIDVALSNRSKILSMQDADKHRRWLADAFATHVFPVKSFQNLMDKYLPQLDTDLARIDADTLVKLYADVDLTKITYQCTDPEAINAYLGTLVDRMYKTIDQSNAAHVASFFFGAAGFEAGRQASNHMLKDENGNVSILGKLFSFGVGMAAEKLTRQVTDEVLDVRSSLKREVNKASQALLSQCTVKGLIPNEFIAAGLRHRKAVDDALIKMTGVERKWVLSTSYVKFQPPRHK